MTICNMAIEAGARAGIIAPDEKTVAYLKGRQHAPKGESWDKAVAYWNTLQTDADAKFDNVVELHGEDIEPQVTWGTSPEQVLPIGGRVPDPAQEADATKRTSIENALNIWAWRRIRRLKRLSWIRFLLALAPIRALKIYVLPQWCAKGKKVASNIAISHGGARLWHRQAPGRRRRFGQNFYSKQVLNGASQVAACVWP